MMNFKFPIPDTDEEKTESEVEKLWQGYGN